MVQNQWIFFHWFTYVKNGSKNCTLDATFDAGVNVFNGSWAGQNFTQSYLRACNTRTGGKDLGGFDEILDGLDWRMQLRLDNPLLIRGLWQRYGWILLVKRLNLWGKFSPVDRTLIYFFSNCKIQITLNYRLSFSWLFNSLN